jgi:hypothetical protein
MWFVSMESQGILHQSLLSTLDGRVQCKSCKKYYVNAKSLASHFSANHSEWGKGKACSFCGIKQLDLRRHEKTCRMRSFVLEMIQ